MTTSLWPGGDTVRVPLPPTWLDEPQIVEAESEDTTIEYYADVSGEVVFHGVESNNWYYLHEEYVYRR